MTFINFALGSDRCSVEMGEKEAKVGEKRESESHFGVMHDWYLRTKKMRLR